MNALRMLQDQEIIFTEMNVYWASARSALGKGYLIDLSRHT